jgi:hypothetical protein
LRCTNAHQQERRSSARRRTENPTCNGDRFSGGGSDYVHHARSDGVPRLADANRSRCRSWWTHANRRKCVASLCTGDSFHNHGWLMLAAPGAALDGCTRIVANVWLRFARANRFTTTAGLHQPLLVRDAGPPKKATFAVHKRTFPRAAGVSPPWCVKPTPRRENRALFSNLRNDHQNRRGQPAVVRETHLPVRLRKVAGVC